MKKVIKILIYMILIAVLIVTVFPILYTFLSSFKTNMEFMTEPGRLFPREFTLDNYKLAWNSESFQVGKMLVNSLYYTLFMVLAQMTISSMCGYVFARGKFRGKKLIFTCFISLIFIKLGGINVYAIFKVLRLIGLTSSLPALMLVNLFTVPVISMYLIMGYVQSLPAALDEAAKIDGCSFFGIYWRIILPLLKPILATVGILAFQASWNDYLMPTIFTVTRPEQRTLIVGLMAMKNSSQSATSWNLMLAGSVIALVPVLGAYAIGNKYFISGLAAGAVKG